METSPNDWAGKLVPQLCEAIWFVMDYVMVQLEQSSITCVGRTQVEFNGQVFTFPEAGSRDWLCELINRRVTRARSFPDDSLEVEFEGSIVLRITPDPEHPEWEVVDVERRR
jgi:hypothetical protein